MRWPGTVLKIDPAITWFCNLLLINELFQIDLARFKPPPLTNRHRSQIVTAHKSPPLTNRHRSQIATMVEIEPGFSEFKSSKF